MSHKTKGTGEWAYKNLNICHGCPNQCKYCYAFNMAYRFGRVKDMQEWGETWKLNSAKVEKGYRKLNNPHPDLYDYMFPTSHDIFPEILHETITVLKKVLRASNSVLITTKPNLECIETICKELKEWWKQICFRFTITSMLDKNLEKWEPHAPRFNERMDALEHAYFQGYKTSISMEPFLDVNPLPIIKKVAPYTENEIWLGIMSGQSYIHHDRDNLMRILSDCKELPPIIQSKIRFKDSIVHLFNLKQNTLYDGIMTDVHPWKVLM